MSAANRLDEPTDSARRTTRPINLASIFLDRVDGYRRRYQPTLDSQKLSGNFAESSDAGQDSTSLTTHESTHELPQGHDELSRCDVSSSDLATDVVVLVHGTYANRQEDEGDSWWQRGSVAWKALARRLPAGVELPEQGEIFHWSGENSERARIKAGNELLDQLKRLEAANRRYHLIGHSHGGSVIWHALRLATLRREPLDGLRTWTTVGTPFLHYRTHGAFSLSNIANLALAMLMLKPAYSAFVGFFGFAWAAILGRNAILRIRSDQEVGLLMAFVRKPFLELFHCAGVPITQTESGLQLGSYDPASGESLFHYLFFTWEGWVVSLVTLFGGYVFLLMASLFLNPVLESLRIRAEKRLERAAMETYRGRWLGLWSVNDEAINGLRATLDLSVSFVAQIAPRDRILLSDYVALISRPYFWLLAPTFNRFVRPLLDRTVRSLVVKTAQGNNRPAAEVVAVSPYPTADSCQNAHPALPDFVDGQLLDRANRHTREMAPKLRELLAEPSFVSGLERFGKALSGNELIHTSYFSHEAILDLLALHIAWGRRDIWSMHRAALSCEDAWRWFCEFKTSVRESVESGLPSGRIPSPHFSRPVAEAASFGRRRA